MRLVILNWSGGENDPFTYFSENLQRRLAELGHEARVVALDERLITSLQALLRDGPVDLAFSWQGLGSSLRPDGHPETLWELLGIPLVCHHGDHPCYNPPCHSQSSRNLIHVYACETFATAANRLIRGPWPGYVDPIPNFLDAPPPPRDFAGEFFVFPKNLEHLDDLKARWQARYDPGVHALLRAGADAIQSAFRTGRPVQHHEITLDLLPAPARDAVRQGHADAELARMVFALASELDRVYRNVASMFIVDTLEDVPLRVFGRGWERYAARRNPNHEFRAFDRVADGATQFHSAYGILDVAPSSEMLHDRTWRAMRQGAGFLICSSWGLGDPMRDQFADLFFLGDPETLRARVRQVQRDPEAHRRLVAAFTEAYDARFPLAGFLERVRGYAGQRGFTLQEAEVS